MAEEILDGGKKYTIELERWELHLIQDVFHEKAMKSENYAKQGQYRDIVSKFGKFIQAVIEKEKSSNASRTQEKTLKDVLLNR